MFSILVVDDSPTELRLITDPLRQKGYRVSTATNGDDALRKAASELPDLVVLDIVMPKPNGYEVCRALRKQDATQKMKILFLSSKNQMTDRAWGLRQGADDYLTKPFEAQMLLDVVARLIG